MSSHIQLSPRVNSLLKPPYHVLDDNDPWRDSFPSLNSFLSKGKDLNKGSNSFHFFMKVNKFRPCEINVKLEDGYVVIQAKQEGKPESHGFVSREFKNQYKIPDGIHPATFHSTFNDSGLLIVKVSKKVPETQDSNEARLPNELLANLSLAEAAQEQNEIA